jgi:ceramide glucosyltransferase
VLVVLTILLAALVAGSAVYCVLAIIGATRYLQARPARLDGTIPISVLKPLHHLEDALEENLRSFFQQDYRNFELLFAVREPDDPALQVVEKLRREFPHILASSMVTGEPPYANAKVFSLTRMLAQARHDLIVMSDSDIRVRQDFLDNVAREFQDPKLGLASCPYRAIPGQSFWSTLEAITINTEFLAGILVARLVEGVKFALGPTIAARRTVLEEIGGFDGLKDYLAEDFVMGKRTAERGWRVILSSQVIDHYIGGLPFGANARHRIRWCRSTRRSRPAGYIGQIFTNPVPLAAALWIAAPELWTLCSATIALRGIAAVTTAGNVLKNPLSTRHWLLLPLADLVSFAFWVAGFFGNTIIWRGRTYYLHPDGRFELVRPPESRSAGA